MKKAIVLAAVSVCLFAASVSAQDEQKDDSKAAALPFKLTFDKTPKNCMGTVKIEDLVANYQDWRQWKALQEMLKGIISRCTDLKPTSEEPTFVTILNGDETYNVLYPKNERYSQLLPGIQKGSAVILMTFDAGKQAKSIDITVASNASPNPLVGQLPDFIKGLVSAASAPFVFKIQGVSGAVDGPPNPPMVAYQAKEVLLPYTRGTVVETGSVTFNRTNAPAAAEPKDNETKTSISVSYTNRPPTKIELATTAGAVVGPAFGHEKMKVDSGKYASDPIGRAVTMASIGWRFQSYDPDSTEINEKQRWMFLIGGVITPAPGFGFGLSRTLVKNFAINAGWASMWVTSAPGDLKPKDDAIADGNQLVYRPTGGIFVGGAYQFSAK